MKGSMVHDILTTTGILILVFLMIYWALNQGVKQTADAMNMAPLMIQEKLATYLTVISLSSGTGEITTKLTRSLPINISLGKLDVFVKPRTEKYFPWSEVERGGAIILKTPSPSAFINPKGSNIDVKENIYFDEKLNKKIIVRKSEGENKISIGVK